MSSLLRKALNDFEIPLNPLDDLSDSSDSDNDKKSRLRKTLSKSNQNIKSIKKKKKIINTKNGLKPEVKNIDKTKVMLDYFKKELSENRFQENLSNLKVLSKLPDKMLKYADKVNSKQKKRSKYEPLNKKKAISNSVFSENDFKKFEEDLQTLFE